MNRSFARPRCPSLRLFLALVFFPGLALCLESARAQTTGTGSIVGAVVSAETRNALQGALVSIPSLNRNEFTDATGRFLLQNLPTGPIEIVVGYSGFEEQRRTVIATAGALLRLETELKPSRGAVLMQAFTVATEREGAALSITEQRNAPNIKNVTALDEWGNLPTLSIAELAMRLPGISFVTDEDNVVNNISIRGMGSNFTRLNVDGMSSTGVGGDGRSATLHSFSGAMYEQIEIIAGQTPERRADGLGRGRRVRGARGRVPPDLLRRRVEELRVVRRERDAARDDAVDGPDAVGVVIRGLAAGAGRSVVAVPDGRANGVAAVVGLVHEEARARAVRDDLLAKVRVAVEVPPRARGGQRERCRPVLTRV